MKNITALFFLIASFSASAREATRVQVLEQQSRYTLLSVKPAGLQFKEVSTLNGKAVIPVIDRGINRLQEGAPDVPKLSVSLQIPNTANSVVSVVSSQYTDYPGVEVAPSKGKLLRSINPATVPYVYGDAYNTDAFFPGSLADLNTPYVFRDVRGQSVHINAVQYNPKTKVLRVYTELLIKVSFDGSSQINTLPANYEPVSLCGDFEGIYQNQFLNYGMYKKLRYSPIKENGKLLVICPSAYLTEVAPFVKWKKMCGFETFLVNADTITGGINEAGIQNTATWYYQQKQIAYMILVGDNTQMPPKNENYTIPTLSGPSDIAYAYINNGDHYPEFIVGRFSGETTEEIRNIVNRTIAYEKTPNTNGNWMAQQIGIASEQGPGDDNQMDYEHIHDIVDSNKNQYTYLDYYELYDGTNSQGWNDAAGYPDQPLLASRINSGASLINYAGHGGTSGIVTTGFSTLDVPSLSNAGKLPFFLVVGCSPGRFVNQTCFAESLLRGGSSATPFGTISNFMSTIDQYWDAPMQAQDEFNAIMRGARPNNLKSRLGALCFNGCASMNDDYDTFQDPTGGSDMTDAWVFFGDPTVSLFNKHLGSISCTHTSTIGRNATWYGVSCPVEGATIGLYYQGEFLASAVVSGGMANFNFPAVANLDTIFITATKQNYIPYMGYTNVIDFATGVNTVNDKNELQLYPNPAGEYMVVNLQDKQIDAVIVRDLAGRTLLSQATSGSEYRLDTRSLAAGQYILEVRSGDEVMNKTFTRK